MHENSTTEPQGEPAALSLSRPAAVVALGWAGGVGGQEALSPRVGSCSVGHTLSFRCRLLRGALEGVRGVQQWLWFSQWVCPAAYPQRPADATGMLEEEDGHAPPIKSHSFVSHFRVIIEPLVVRVF